MFCVNYLQVVPDIARLEYSKSRPTRLGVQLCLYVPYKGSRCTVDLCSVWSCMESCGEEICPAPLKLLTLHPSHPRLSQLAALQRDGPEWSRPRRSVHSQIHDQQMPRGCEFALPFIFALVIFLVEHSSKIFST